MRTQGQIDLDNYFRSARVNPGPQPQPQNDSRLAQGLAVDRELMRLSRPQRPALPDEEQLLTKLRDAKLLHSNETTLAAFMHRVGINARQIAEWPIENISHMVELSEERRLHEIPEPSGTFNATGVFTCGGVCHDQANQNGNSN